MSLDLSVLWVIFFVLVLVGVLNSLLFKPLLKVMHEREAASASARALAAKAAADAAAALQQYEQRTAAARAEVNREMDEVRRVAEAKRTELVAATRAEAQAQLDDARASLAADTAAARARLEADAEVLGATVVERILGRQTR